MERKNLSQFLSREEQIIPVLLSLVLAACANPGLMNESIPSPVSKLLKGQTNIGQNTAGPLSLTGLAGAMVVSDLSSLQ